MATLFVSYTGLWGGAERLLVDVAPAAPDPWLACPPGRLADAARAAGVRVAPTRERPLEVRATPRDRLLAPARHLAQAREVRALLSALEPDTVVAWSARALLVTLAARGRGSRRPRLVFMQNDLVAQNAIGRAVRVAARRADVVVSPSSAAARSLDPEGRLTARTRIVHPGVDLERFAPRPPGPRAPEALLLGAIVAYKQPELALEAVALAARDLPDLTLRLAGPTIDAAGPALLAALRRRAQAPDLAGRVTFEPTLEDPREALARAGCLLHCAEREPYGRVLVEALASGVPVVAPAVAGPGEIVDATCGRTYAPGDAAAAARALVEVLGDPALAARLAAAAPARAAPHGLATTCAAWASILAAETAEEKPAGPAAGAGIALVTVTHDSAAALGALLASVSRHLPGAAVVVVDSGSADSSAEVARSWPGGATVIELGHNAGFGAATNAGLRAVPPGIDVTVMLNPDVELLDGSLERLAREAAAPGAPDRLLAPLVVGADGRRQDSVHPAPASPPDLVRALVPPAALPGALRRALDPSRATAPRPVGWAVGCCVAARTEVLRRLGPFDERIFMYGEDLDLGLRAAEAGVVTWWWPGARVLHHGAHATRRAYGGEAFERLARARREVVEARGGVARRRLDDLAQLVTFAGRAALKALLRRDNARERRQLSALRRSRRREPPGG